MCQKMIDVKNGKFQFVFEPRVLSDTPYVYLCHEHLTAEEMEATLVNKDVGHQARHFAKLAVDHYNNKEENTTKIEICTTLLSKCFHEICGSAFGHVNFTAKAKNDDQAKKNLYFAELKLNPDLLGRPDVEPMCVVCVYNLDGGCHEISRKIDYKTVGNLDYERCHACSDRIKHSSGNMFTAGHDSTKTPYFSAG
uniref:DUF3615 domain-containing protein n=1 Tax=Leersia perrieri TaxID=77586 RepID=A0A0D9WJB8_9ORYZ